jgi:hypothetical protein
MGLRNLNISESILQGAERFFENIPGSQFILIPLARARSARPPTWRGEEASGGPAPICASCGAFADVK